ncbi:vomeronasal type-1 receptor 4-like [Grammomys surdaster]|uniref:vomeronasal type-1 receptor 4-like n=1 Tax=Grammomys surdaster TaxID=491861 RepID=UPI00109F7B2C|nr:vomeronasal type-1 receptor 4-like [Grammomys surdaster]
MQSDFNNLPVGKITCGGNPGPVWRQPAGVGDVGSGVLEASTPTGPTYRRERSKVPEVGSLVAAGFRRHVESLGLRSLLFMACPLISSQDKAMKTTEEVALQILLLCQVGIGTVANIILFVHNLSPLLTGCQLRPRQVIFTHMAVANILILLMTVFPNNVMSFAQRNSLNDLTCKLEYFLLLMARSTNLCFTCILCCYQFVTLVPGNFGELMLRRSPKVISYSCCSCWLFGVLYNVYIPMKVSGPQNTHNETDIKSKWVCFTSGFSVGIIFLQFAHDGIFISVTIWTSVSMVHILYRHHQRLKHILTPHQEHKGYAEIRAAHSIVMLVVTFVSFYLLHCICFILHMFFVDSCLWLRHVGEVLMSSFPTISPLLLILRDPNYPCSLIFNY